jgi:hypothetical protein
VRIVPRDEERRSGLPVHIACTYAYVFAYNTYSLRKEDRRERGKGVGMSGEGEGEGERERESAKYTVHYMQ